ncbi:hypothetical protein L6452_08572 [Arctium lappa]|uniref:Uncharacterized protein n=1 Tax=Arctium lappa TaxID=4217 RepID=A0ACB9DHN5_ARCLA|nr:hypothetical protein L6452_08572 [Arctium lappa]
MGEVLKTFNCVLEESENLPWGKVLISSSVKKSICEIKCIKIGLLSYRINIEDEDSSLMEVLERDVLEGSYSDIEGGDEEGDDNPKRDLAGDDGKSMEEGGGGEKPESVGNEEVVPKDIEEGVVSNNVGNSSDKWEGLNKGPVCCINKSGKGVSGDMGPVFMDRRCVSSGLECNSPSRENNGLRGTNKENFMGKVAGPNKRQISEGVVGGNFGTGR